MSISLEIYFKQYKFFGMGLGLVWDCPQNISAPIMSCLLPTQPNIQTDVSKTVHVFLVVTILQCPPQPDDSLALFDVAHYIQYILYCWNTRQYAAMTRVTSGASSPPYSFLQYSQALEPLNLFVLCLSSELSSKSGKKCSCCPYLDHSTPVFHSDF